MYDHFLDNGIARNYVQWLMHGEYEYYKPTNTNTNEPDMYDEMQEMLNDAFGVQILMLHWTLKKFHMFMMSLKSQIRMRTNFIIC